MNRYIIQPRDNLGISSVELISTRFTPDQRQAQMNELLSLRRANPVEQDIHRWIADSKGHDMTTPMREPVVQSITGTMILDMPETEAERMRAELPDVFILRDQPLDLIRPRRSVILSETTQVSSTPWHLKVIGLQLARQLGFSYTGRGVTIAVLDTGIDATHPELEGKIAAAYTFNVQEGTAQPMTPSQDTYGHGTHVAGLICGKTVGVAPNSSIISGVMIPQGRGNLSDFVVALGWVCSQPEVQIVNVSAGISGYVPGMRPVVETLLQVGVLPVVAVGNEGRDKTRSPGNYIEVVSVGAMNQQNRVASFSSGGTLIANNHQHTVPDMVAPGEDICSSVVGGGYEAWDGTSMAAAIVSGIAALFLEEYPNITVTELDEALLEACYNLGQPPTRQGRGLIQIRPVL